MLENLIYVQVFQFSFPNEMNFLYVFELIYLHIQAN